VDVVVAQRGEDLPHRLADRLDDLDRIAVANDAAEQAGLEAGTRADLQRDIGRLGCRQLGHIGLAQIVGEHAAMADGPGLGIGLIGLIGGRGVRCIRIVIEVARHAFEGLHHLGVMGPEAAVQIGSDALDGGRFPGLDLVELGLADRVGAL